MRGIVKEESSEGKPKQRVINRKKMEAERDYRVHKETVRAQRDQWWLRGLP